MTLQCFTLLVIWKAVVLFEILLKIHDQQDLYSVIAEAGLDKDLEKLRGHFFETRLNQ